MTTNKSLNLVIHSKPTGPYAEEIDTLQRLEGWQKRFTDVELVAEKWFELAKCGSALARSYAGEEIGEHDHWCAKCNQVSLDRAATFDRFLRHENFNLMEAAENE